MYADIRQSTLAPAQTCQQFRQERDDLFRTHPQSALSNEQKAGFTGLNYYPYDPALRFILPIDSNVEPAILDIPLQEDGLMRMQRFGKVHFSIGGEAVSLSLYWILGYGGGIFNQAGSLVLDWARVVFASDRLQLLGRGGPQHRGSGSSLSLPGEGETLLGSSLRAMLPGRCSPRHGRRPGHRRIEHGRRRPTGVA
jgi:hypothetical protein